MIVHFTRKGRGLAHEVMDAVPRSGEVVMLGDADSPEIMRVWNVAWRVMPPSAYVELRTEPEYIRELYGRRGGPGKPGKTEAERT